jgi:hypothetical protein
VVIISIFFQDLLILSYIYLITTPSIPI